MKIFTRLMAGGATPLTLMLALAGCQSTASHTAASPQAAPMDLEQSDSAWVYLSDKYDADGDGVIVLAEYDRSGGEFDRLDRDDSGDITAADFEQGRDMAQMMRSVAPQMYVGMYFQDDDDADTMTVDELESAIEVYDASGDGAVEEDEFLAIAEDRRVEPTGDRAEMMRRMMRNIEPWDAMVDGVDDDDDGDLTADELIAFFQEGDEDGDGVLIVGGERPMTGPAEGELAPDFYLYPPDPGEAVALSSFQNNLPVALIFGSYT